MGRSFDVLTMGSGRCGTPCDPQWGSALAHAESDNGVDWRRPPLDVVQINNHRAHLILNQDPHGATVIYDEGEGRPRRRYKLLAGATPSDRISAYRSVDGTHWLPEAEYPVVGINPDCPMSLHHTHDGRYVLYCRPGGADRRVSRRESWDLGHWSEPRTVIDQEPGDHLQTQFCVLGAVPYGAYEIGTLWIYHTESTDMGFWKMHGHQQTELTNTRSGYVWHRAELGHAWIPLGDKNTWEWGGIQLASVPVLLEEEIRFYYVGTHTEHGSEVSTGSRPRCGIGFASLKPDRFVSVDSSDEGHVLTRVFWAEVPEFCGNAEIACGGELWAAVLDSGGQPIQGCELERAIPSVGGSMQHRLEWKDHPDRSVLAHRGFD